MRARIRRSLFGVGRLLPALIPLLILVHTGRIGIDLGVHWDEHLQFRSVARSIKSGVLVPGVYNYPSMSYWLTLGTVLPRLVREWRPVPDLIEDMNTQRSLELETTELQNYVRTDHALLLRARFIFLVVSSLVVVWVYLLVLFWRRRVGEAFLAAALMGLSWEFAYHARWVAPDTVMTSFAALTMLGFTIAGTLERPRAALLLAAFAAGLAAGTKYQCGLLLLPVLLQVFRARSRDGMGGFFASAWRVLAVFAATFLLTTPAVLLDSGRVLRWVLYVVSQYKSGDHGGYAVAAGFPHLGQMLAYLGGEFFSAHLPIACATSLFILLGVWALFRESRGQAVVFLSFPVLYLAYMSTQRVFIVRNILVVSPFLAVAAARGVRFALALVSPRLPSRQAALRTTVAVVALCAVGLGANAWWLYQAARSIPRATAEWAVANFGTYVASRAPGTVFAANAVRGALQAQGLDVKRLAVRADQARELAFYPYEWLYPHPSNVWRAASTWFGPLELNWNRYTDWGGFQRIVVVSARRARSLGIRLDPLPGAPAPSPPPKSQGPKSQGH